MKIRKMKHRRVVTPWLLWGRKDSSVQVHGPLSYAWARSTVEAYVRTQRSFFKGRQYAF